MLEYSHYVRKVKKILHDTSCFDSFCGKIHLYFSLSLVIITIDSLLLNKSPSFWNKICTKQTHCPINQNLYRSTTSEFSALGKFSLMTIKSHCAKGELHKSIG